MNPLNKDQKQSILERANFIEIELGDLKTFSGITKEIYLSNRDSRRNIERIVENLANAVIDICKIALAGEPVEMPNTYQEIILKLGEINILDAQTASKLASLAKARNILAHQYLDLKWDIIKDIMNDAPQVIPVLIKSLKI